VADTHADLTSASPFASTRRIRAGLPWPVLGVVSAGGVVGALCRYALGQAYPHPAAGFPWATFGINVSCCLLIGVLMVLVAEVWPTRRLLRPFLGTGLLGGYTTFSTYVVDVQHLVTAGAARTALVYLVATVLAALAATYAGVSATRLLTARIRHRKETRG